MVPMVPMFVGSIPITRKSQENPKGNIPWRLQGVTDPSSESARWEVLRAAQDVLDPPDISCGCCVPAAMARGLQKAVGVRLKIDGFC